jgi:hypothetical protein
VRAIGLRAAADAVGDEALAYWLTWKASRAPLSTAARCARPEAAKRKRFRLF